ncbi:hypothetical protein LCGC14_0586260 [marine sediment metagenome]|uniref:Uncharacterized protein n=1 Tax=marine sediment metagenome TaxID=412755 RepID=A0A0F9REU8_9ZZZZ
MSKTTKGKLRFEQITYNSEFMINYRKKPIVIQAIQVLEAFEVETLEGLMQGKANDYLVKGINSELYPVDREIFHKTYEMWTK